MYHAHHDAARPRSRTRGTYPACLVFSCSCRVSMMPTHCGDDSPQTSKEGLQPSLGQGRLRSISMQTTPASPLAHTLRTEGSCTGLSRETDDATESLERRAICPRQAARALEWKLRILAGYQVYHRRGIDRLPLDTYESHKSPRVAVLHCQYRSKDARVSGKRVLASTKKRYL